MIAGGGLFYEGYYSPNLQSNDNEISQNMSSKQQ